MNPVNNQTAFSQKQSYLLAVGWTLLAYFVSACNDALSKLSGSALPAANILFFRFLFSFLTLLPLVYASPKKFRTSHMKVHALRGMIFTVAMLPWCFGLIKLPMPLMTVLGFTIPLFVTLLAKIVLKESLGWQRAGTTGIGFLGILLSVGVYFQWDQWGVMLLALLATFLFALLDIINKHLLTVEEGMEPMILFSSMFTTLCTIPLVFFQWQWPSFGEVFYLLLLGVGANGFLFCLLKASALYEVSALQPFRYSEFFFSGLLSVLLFQQWPPRSILWGLLCIVPSACYLSYYELRKTSKAQQVAEC